jgi:uncharacterized membrane protein
MRRWWLGPVSTLATLGFGLAVQDRLPRHVATHWNIHGEADGWMGPAAAVWMLPIFAAGIWLLLVLLPRIDPRRASYGAFRGTYWLIVNATMLFLVGVQVVILGSALGWDLPVAQVFSAGIGLLLAVIGAQLGSLEPNWFFGIRTPWTLADPEVWRRTHRVGARTLTWVGLGIAVAALLLPVSAGFVVLMTGAIGSSLLLVAYSYLLWRRRQPARGQAPR